MTIALAAVGLPVFGTSNTLTPPIPVSVGPPYGSAQNAYTTQVPTATINSIGTFGNDVQFAVGGQISGLRYYRPANATSITRNLRVWSSTGVLLGTAATGVGGFGSDQSVFTGVTVAGTSTTFIGAVGNDITSAVKGRITALRYYKSAAASASSRTLRLWSSSGVLLGTATTSGDTGSGWKTATLTNPIAIAAGQKVRVAMDNPTGQLQNDVLAGPISSGSLTLNPITSYTDVTTGNYPNTAAAVTYFVDVIFQPGNGDVGEGWMTGYLSTPIQVVAGQVVRISMDVSSENASRWSNSATDIVNGNVTLLKQGWQNGSTGVYPATTSATSYFVDVLFEAGTIVPTTDNFFVVVIAGRFTGTDGAISIPGYVDRGKVIRTTTTNAVLKIMTKHALSTEPAPTITCDDGTQGWGAVIIRFTGVDNSDARDAYSVVNNTVGTLTIVGPTVTTRSNNALLLAAAVTTDDNDLRLLPGSEAGFSLLSDTNTWKTLTGADFAFALAMRLVATAGSTAGPTWEQTTNGPDQWGVMGLSFREQNAAKTTPFSVWDGVSVETAVGATIWNGVYEDDYASVTIK